MKILHSADWHLDSPMAGHSTEQSRYLRSQLLTLPEKVANLCKKENCDLLLLCGDLFDGVYTKESLNALRSALESVEVPVFIAPGNHDFCGKDSPYLTESFPENVHIFTHPVLESVSLPQLDCRIYGAGYDAMDCPALLKNFSAAGQERWHIGLLHADPLQANSPYAPLNAQQVRASGLHYLALGHVHKGDSFLAGDTLCAWPGAPMGRGYDESGIKGVLLVELEETVTTRFVPLDTPCFYDETAVVGESPEQTLAAILPPTATQNFYRITLTGYCDPMDTAQLASQFPHVPNLQLRDRTAPETDLWGDLSSDNLEGLYFKLLHDGLDTDSEKLQQRLKLAARISRQILDGQEVVLP